MNRAIIARGVMLPRENPLLISCPITVEYLIVLLSRDVEGRYGTKRGAPSPRPDQTKHGAFLDLSHTNEPTQKPSEAFRGYTANLPTIESTYADQYRACMRSLARPYDSENLHEWLPAFARNAKILGVGESSHGTQEFFQAQADIARHLIEHGNARLILMELPTIYGMYAHHLMSRGSEAVANFIRAAPFATWHNSAIADLVLFVDAWNRAHPHDTIRFVGFDPRRDGCIEALLNYCKGRGEPIAGLRSWCTQSALALRQVRTQSAESGTRSLTPAELARRGMIIKVINELCRQATELERQVTTDLFAAQTLFFSVKHMEFMARSLQAGTIRASEARDTIMAEIVLKEVSRLTDSQQAVVLAHSAHVSYGPPGVFSYGMGHHIRKGVGEALYRVLVTATGEGSVRTLADASAPRRELFVADASPEGSLESILHESNNNHPRVYDLQGARANQSMTRYLNAPIGFRSTGSLVYRNEFTILRPLEQFDGIIFFPRSQGAREP